MTPAPPQPEREALEEFIRANRAQGRTRIFSIYPLEFSDLEALLVTAQHVEAAEQTIDDQHGQLVEAFTRAEQAEQQLEELRRAVELDAAHAAYKAGLGAGEWEAFVGVATWDALKDLPALSAHPKTEERQGYIEPEGDERCGAIKDACTCMKRKGHEGSHACVHGTWRADPKTEEPR